MSGKSALSVCAIPKRRHPKSPLQLPHPVPRRGALAIVTNVGRGAVDAAASGAWWCSQGGLWSVSEHSAQTTGTVSVCANSFEGPCPAEALAKADRVRQSRVVLAPVAGVKLAKGEDAQPVDLRRQFADDGDKTNSSPGRARNKP